MSVLREIADNPLAFGLLFFLGVFIANRTIKAIKLINKINKL